MTLATPAFVDLPDEYLKTEAIAKFCQGCSDKDAAKHACFEHPSTMEEALNLVKHHQYISQAVDGKRHEEEMRLQWMLCSLHLKLGLNSLLRQL